MAKATRKRISYGKVLSFQASTTAHHSSCIVLPLDSDSDGHRLGVNGLAFDEEQSILCVLQNRASMILRLT